MVTDQRSHFHDLRSSYYSLSIHPSMHLLIDLISKLNECLLTTVVDNKADALKAALAVFGTSTGSSFSSGGCQSLTEIGFTEWAKTQTAHTNYKGLAIANFGTSPHSYHSCCLLILTSMLLALIGKPDYVRYTNAGMTADHFFTTASALTEDGRLVCPPHPLHSYYHHAYHTYRDMYDIIPKLYNAIVTKIGMGIRIRNTCIIISQTNNIYRWC
jgi:hypothetical protein